MAILAVLNSWGIHYETVIGHSSGEIAAATASGFLTVEAAIKVAYYRGRAASDIHEVSDQPLGMLAVGLGWLDIQKYMEHDNSTEIACVNSPQSVTLSGKITILNELKRAIEKDGYFARLLQVDLAYHSNFMTDIARHYQNLLELNYDNPLPTRNDVKMFSTVTGKFMDDLCDANYWKNNMISPVLFNQAFQAMVSEPTGPDFLIEIGPSGALAGPIAQIKHESSGYGISFEYASAFKRGPESVNELYHLAGKIFLLGGSINMLQVNQDEDPQRASVIIDLPNYAWNHSAQYWHESESSKDWRFREFVQHDLLGSKVLGTSWTAPSWRKTLRVNNLPWLKDHKVCQNALV